MAIALAIGSNRPAYSAEAIADPVGSYIENQLQPKAVPDFDKEVMVPLKVEQEKQREQEAAREAQIAAEAKAARQAVVASRTRSFTAQLGAYRNSYAWGNCTWYVASRRLVPSSWGNARTWFWSAQSAGWQTGSVPQVGAIAQTMAGYYGHVAIVEAVQGSSVLVSEMNYRGLDIIDQRWASASSFNYIY